MRTFNNFKINYLSIITASLCLIFVSCYKSLAAEPITSPRCNQFTFDATGSHDPDNEKINYQWNFGDGESSQDAVVNHTFKKPGDYLVTLRTTDNSGLECSTAVTSQMIRANIPPIASFAASDLACTNQPITLEASADPANKTNYDWSFGDGTKTQNQKNVTKTYTKGGDYKIILTADNGSGTVCSSATAEHTIHVNEPPIAEAGDAEILKCVSDDNDMMIAFDGSQSSDINNDNLTYLWDFGDGQKAAGPKANHKYAQLGNYDAKLIVKDETNKDCATAVDFVAVRLNKASRANAGEDVLTCKGETVNFDGSQSTIYKKGTITARWIFGDGESADTLKATHSYSKPGKYQASLSIEDKLNAMCPVSTDTRIVIVNSPPTVSLTALDSACLGSTVQFDASSATDPDGDKLKFHWTFGDGTSLVDGAKVTHEYKQGGNYRVSVIVDDGVNSLCSNATASKNIKINSPPVADAGANSACCVDMVTEFNAQASSDPDTDKLTYTWDFGDGTTGDGQLTKHAYRESGSYNVTLTVDDESETTCSKSTAGFVAHVNSTPVPVINVR